MSGENDLIFNFDVPHAEEPRVFRLIISHGAYETSKKGNADIGGCDHVHYDLDERWSKVSCHDCGIELQAFDVLRRYQEWADRWHREKHNKWMAERNLLRSRLRILYHQRRFSEEDKAAMAAILKDNRTYDVDPTELRRIVDDLDRKIGGVSP